MVSDDFCNVLGNVRAGRLLAFSADGCSFESGRAYHLPATG